MPTPALIFVYIGTPRMGSEEFQRHEERLIEIANTSHLSQQDYQRLLRAELPNFMLLFKQKSRFVLCYPRPACFVGLDTEYLPDHAYSRQWMPCTAQEYRAAVQASSADTLSCIDGRAWALHFAQTRQHVSAEVSPLWFKLCTNPTLPHLYFVAKED